MDINGTIFIHVMIETARIEHSRLQRNKPTKQCKSILEPGYKDTPSHIYSPGCTHRYAAQSCFPTLEINSVNSVSLTPKCGRIIVWQPGWSFLIVRFECIFHLNDSFLAISTKKANYAHKKGTSTCYTPLEHSLG